MTKNIYIIIGVVLVVVLVGIFLFSTGTNRGEIRSFTAKVILVNTEEDSFTIVEQGQGQDYVVFIGEETEFVRLVFTFDPEFPPEGDTFIPEKQPASIANLEVGEFIFILSSHAIETGKDIINPVEIKILP